MGPKSEGGPLYRERRCIECGKIPDRGWGGICEPCFELREISHNAKVLQRFLYQDARSSEAPKISKGSVETPDAVSDSVPLCCRKCLGALGDGGRDDLCYDCFSAEQVFPPHNPRRCFECRRELGPGGGFGIPMSCYDCLCKLIETKEPASLETVLQHAMEKLYQSPEFQTMTEVYGVRLALGRKTDISFSIEGTDLNSLRLVCTYEDGGPLIKED